MRHGVGGKGNKAASTCLWEKKRMNCHNLENKEQEICLYCGWSALHYQAPALLCLSFSGLDNQWSIRKDADKPQLRKGDLFLSFTGAWTFQIISSIKILKNLCRTDDSKKKCQVFWKSGWTKMEIIIGGSQASWSAFWFSSLISVHTAVLRLPSFQVVSMSL